MTKQFDEVKALLDFTQDMVTKISADLADDGKIGIVEAIKLAVTEVPEAVKVALNVKDLGADLMSKDELVQSLTEAVAIVAAIATLFVKK